ncbi:MAG: polysaccharide deacetylase family protein [Paludibacter sp.]|nr:polysaccharide deacetylase family protein [Paludibacter sp.]
MDNATSNIHLKIFGEKPGLNTFLFHACLEKDADFERNLIYPQERLTVSRFKNFIDYFLHNGYEFIDPTKISSTQLNPNRKYGLITFDDGYYNQFNILPVLEEYKIPAVFYVPTDYLDNGKNSGQTPCISTEKRLVEVMKLFYRR